jgi:hypothetical protein
MTNETVDCKNAKPSKASLADAIIKGQKKAYAMKTDEQIGYRAEIITRAYESSKTDHALKSKVFVYYVKEVKKQGFTLEQVLPFFKSEIEGMFEALQLKEIATDETTKEKVDAEAVFKNIKRLFNQASDRFDRAAGVANKGPDANKEDPLAAIRSTFEQKSIVNISDAFWQIKSEKRKEEIIKALFEKLTAESKAALYLELEAMAEDGEE